MAESGMGVSILMEDPEPEKASESEEQGTTWAAEHEEQMHRLALVSSRRQIRRGTWCITTPVVQVGLTEGTC
jgi:hypothetical protein